MTHHPILTHSRLLTAMLLTVLLTAATTSSCTQNDGHIGRWFGFWRLETITVDGEPDTAYDSNIVWAFQGDIIQISLMLPGHDLDSGYGTWTDGDGALTINFDYRSAEPTDYDLPAAMHLGSKGTYRFAISDDHGNRLTLTTTNPDGRRIAYRLARVY